MAKDRRQLLIGPRRHARGDAGPELAAVAIAAVAAGAALREDLASSIGRLRDGGRREEEC